MLTGPVGRELLPNWPRQLWDEMLRMPQVRAGRQCVFPEVPRTHTYGKVGASRGEGYKRYLETMPLDSAVIEWDAQVSGFASRFL
jgi:alpha-1,3-mannosyl-glycoprotein beta-1,2-N-acetylglucosaminyltransferase